jgi:proteasome accessory factor B
VGVVSYRGRWYVTGHDADRGEPRVFRLSRVQGDVLPDGRPGSFEVPPGTDLRATTQALAPQPANRTARVLARHGAAQGMRRHAAAVQEDAPDGWDALEVRYAATDAFADEVLGYGADVVVLSPEDVRASVVRRLEESAASSTAGAAS